MVDKMEEITSCFDEILRQTGSKPNRCKFGIEVAKVLNETVRRNGKKIDLSLFNENGDAVEFFVSTDEALIPVELKNQAERKSKPYFRQNERY